MELAYSLPLLAALGYAVAALFSKRALVSGFGVLRLSFVTNLIFVPFFALVLFGHEGVPTDAQWLHPVLAGCLFFTGQALTFAAIRMGDVSIQTPLMGTKAVFVVLLALLLGIESVSTKLVLAAFVSMCAVALLGFSGIGGCHVGRAILLSLCSAFFFSVSDTMVGLWGNDFGSPLFLFIMISTNGLLSFALIPFFNSPMHQVASGAWRWGLLSAVFMAVQALVLNYSLATFQNVSSANVLYSTRGFWSVALGCLPIMCFANADGPMVKSVRNARLLGALVMCAAIFILFSN